MAEYKIQDTTLTAIANSIRAKTGGSSPILTENMSSEINGITTPSLEGTAIPVGEPVERIYFNTNLTIEETNAYLSQLTYVQTPLADVPISLIWACVNESLDGHIFFATDIGDNRYEIYYMNSMANDIQVYIFSTSGWWYIPLTSLGANSVYPPDFLVNGMSFKVTPSGSFCPTDFQGLPIGLENEKIKNVMSITPFAAEGIAPIGTLQVTANGTYDVTAKASVVVAIPTYDGTVVIG